ncbi:MAG: cytochrome c maturation protein CcmE [Gemmatimonadetes bacterium]|jgi:cytochrome c-type biogenesis protein CcmE|nr:cytochrome c maturation protein CcmE [Gemmatimonadota bacterium]MBP9107173.1 cytochrome c maturation protein CcmE [Gemmatimonadaceae bacterium]MBK6455292.1 cytochrome c maturation protein CcmE [Gemmatimonadota bacterium]MBK6841483.1 cytochrome c maturation protein CcmE [Gemmatimonadota bacterium]MBK7835166.1 cytochrome c maturation protein CcmE [Gemmatimonadota bacterium]
MSGNIEGRKRAALLVAAVIVIGGTFGYLMYGGLDKNVVYFLTPQELLAKGTKVVDVPVRLGGMVAPGSVKWDAEKLDLRFQVMDGVKTVEVHSKGAPPQMFRDNMGVVCEGRFKNGVFESTNLMIKHSEEYRAPKEGQTPQEMYKEMFKTLREDAKS